MYKVHSRFIYLVLIFLFNNIHSINFQFISIDSLKSKFNEFKKIYEYFESYQEITNYVDDAKNLLSLKLKSLIDYPLFYYKTKNFYNKVKNPKTENNNEEDKSRQFKMTNDEIIESYLIVINNLINLHSIKSIKKFTLLNGMQILLILLNTTKTSMRLIVCYKLNQRIMS